MQKRILSPDQSGQWYVRSVHTDSLGCDKLAAIVFHGVKASHQAQYMATTIGLDD